jgi:hypothetical protein
VKVFVLEDDETRIALIERAAIGHELTVARDTEDALKKFAPPYNLLLLDHDLGGRVFVDSNEEDCGAAFCRRAPFRDDDTVIVHSYNRAGAMEMLAIISERQPDARAIWQPFGPSVLAIFARKTS